jgi:hypothetical protein
MVQRTGDQGAGGVTFVKNSFYHDAFFLKAQGRCIIHWSSEDADIQS